MGSGMKEEEAGADHAFELLFVCLLWFLTLRTLKCATWKKPPFSFAIFWREVASMKPYLLLLLLLFVLHTYFLPFYNQRPET